MLANQLLGRRKEIESGISRLCSAIRTSGQTSCPDMHHFKEIGVLETKKIDQTAIELNGSTSYVLK